MIDLENVSKTYSAGAPAVNDINLHIEKGEFVFVVGNSGAGKSTLIKLLLKELEPTAGRIIINGKDLRKIKHRKIHLLRRDIGVVFQDFRLLKDRTVFENVAFAQRIIGRNKREIIRNVSTMLTIVGLTEKADAYPHELSGGEQQRVAIARALVNQPTILLADEPTGNLDPQNAWEIMMLLQEVNKMGTTVVVVTHNNDIVDIMQKRVVTLEEGRVIRDDKKGGYEYERD